MLDFLKMLLTPEFFFSIIRISAPILFATLAAIVVEKAGFCNIGLEGLMMFSALTGSLVSYYAHSWVWGLLAALAIGVLMSLMMGFFAFQLKTDITLVGIAVNMMGSGGTLFLCKVITNLSEGTSMASSTGLITSNLLIPNINIPLIDKIPFLGSIISGHNLLTWIAFICCALTSVMLYKTSLGLNIRAVGENPNAASSVGVSVLKIKYIAIGFSGLMCGFGGAFISWAIIISVAGSWLSFTMLPAEVSSMMADHHELPAKWGELNKKNSPQYSLLIVGALTEIFIIVATFAADAYTFAISMCTVTIVVTWAYAAAYQVKLAKANNDAGQMVIGVLALLFQVVGVLFTGWGFLLLACLGYIPGFFFYKQARDAEGSGIVKSEVVLAVVIAIAGIISIPLTAVGIIPVF